MVSINYHNIHYSFTDSTHIHTRFLQAMDISVLSMLIMIYLSQLILCMTAAPVEIEVLLLCCMYLCIL